MQSPRGEAYGIPAPGIPSSKPYVCHQPLETQNEIPTHPDQEEFPMSKSVLAALVALLILSSAALAAGDDDSRCNPFKVAGAYVRQTSPYIDQLTLGVDGTAYWFSSASFDSILLGAFTPENGSWTCLDDGTVLVTTIGSQYFQNSPAGDIPQPGQPLDLNLAENIRITQKLSVVDKDTLRLTHNITTHIPLSNDPLGSGVVNSCTPTGTPCNPVPYKRIRPQLTDIP